MLIILHYYLVCKSGFSELFPTNHFELEKGVMMTWKFHSIFSLTFSFLCITPGWVLGYMYISDGDVRRPFLGLKFSAWDFFWV